MARPALRLVHSAPVQAGWGERLSGLASRAVAGARRLLSSGAAPSSGRRSAQGQQFALKWDAAQNGDLLKNHWAWADALSADAAASASVRATIRKRSRYEAQNSPLLRGMMTTLADDLVGTGPRLQLVGGSSARRLARIEADFDAWQSHQRVTLASLLHTMRMGRAVDGEAFAIQISDDQIDGPVRLSLMLVEPEQFCAPWMATVDTVTTETDGVVLDAAGRPSSFWMMTTHPGSTTGVLLKDSWKQIQARYVYHWYKRERAGQHRGIPETAPSLMLLAMLREYSDAALAAARTAATFAGVMKTQAPPDYTEPSEQDAGETGAQPPETMDTIRLPNAGLLVLPDGYDLAQLKAEHPTTGYPDQLKAYLRQIARPWSMPLNIALGDSSDYNYASGRLDHQTYYRAIDVDRQSCEAVVLNPLLRSWLAEYQMVTGVKTSDLSHQWYWPGREHVDPVKEATAQQIRMDVGTTTLQREYAGQGLDWEQELRQRLVEEQRENEIRAELGLPPKATKPGPKPLIEQNPQEDQA